MTNALNMKSYYLIIISAYLFIIGCDDNNYQFEYDTIVTETPVNLEKINSRYDDYNSTLPYDGYRFGIYFSSNRKSSGQNFDIVYKDLDISYHKKDDKINISFPTNTFDKHTSILLSSINSQYDELGPLFYFANGEYEYFLYSNNENSDFDIKYVYNYKSTYDKIKVRDMISSPRKVVGINSEFDDMYPTITKDYSKLYFCSNREGNVFNIFKNKFSQNEFLPIDSIKTDKYISHLDTILSSNYNDKCPSITDSIMVFTSDREGGFGGFDLYYSIYKDNTWSNPINFGSNINSEFDEYRPIIAMLGGSDRNMVIFSSNRPGGKGGFDLYAVRIEFEY